MDDDFEPYSPASLAALDRATVELIEALRFHVTAVGELENGSNAAGLFALNEQVAEAIRTWNDSAFDHTGTFAVPMLEYPDDDPEDDIAEDAVDVDPLATTDADTTDDDPVQLSVVTRWDLEVDDPAALLAAGREAHRTLEPSASAEDAIVAVPDDNPALALYSLIQLYGDPMLEAPGVTVLGGARVYVEADEEIEPPLDEDFDLEDVPDAVELIDGTLRFTELW